MFFNKTKKISTEELEKLGNDAYVIDVREVDEYKSGHINNAINVPLGGIENFVPKKQPIYVVCQSGMRSAHATKVLEKKGYDAINVSGGMNRWSGPVVR